MRVTDKFHDKVHVTALSKLFVHQHSVPSRAVSIAVYTALLGIKNTDVPKEGGGGEGGKTNKKEAG